MSLLLQYRSTGRGIYEMYVTVQRNYVDDPLSIMTIKVHYFFDFTSPNSERVS